MPVSEVVALQPAGIDVIIPVDGLPDQMIGYRWFTAWSTTDPVVQTSVPVSSLATGRGSLEIYDQVDGYFIYVDLYGYASDPGQSWIELDRIVDLVLAIEDRVRENHFEVEATESPGHLQGSNGSVVGVGPCDEHCDLLLLMKAQLK